MLIESANPILRRRAMAVRRVTKATQALFDEMLAVMNAREGIGIAAPQIGHSLRMCIVRTDPNKPTWFMVNPVLEEVSTETVTLEEGCLSFPGQVFRVERHAGVYVSFLDYSGHRRGYWCVGLAAICVQHEMDHLDGITFDMRALSPTDGAPAAPPKVRTP